MAGVEVLCALRGAAEVEIVTELEAFGPRLTVTRRCADLAELLAAAEAGLGHVALVSADLALLDRESVAFLHEAGLRVVAVTQAPTSWSGDRARALGVEAVTQVSEVGQAVLAAASAPLRAPADVLRADGAGEGVAPQHGSASEALEAWDRGSPALGAERSAGLDAGGAVLDEYASPRGWPDAVPGRIIAVWGPTGAPGRTTLAINLAAELAAVFDGPSARGVLLVDADTYGGTVAQQLGLLDESPGLAAVARAAGQGRLDAELLSRHAPVIGPGLRVLTGLSRPVRWPELAGPSLDLAWDVAREIADVTVIDCGFCLEQDEAITYDTRAPHRNAATLSALGAADHVVIVGSAEPIGIQRLVRGLAEIDEVVTQVRRSVVVNRVRASAVGARPGEAIVAALSRYANVHEVVLVPDDRSATDMAVLEGRTLRESAPGSPARRAIAALANELVAGQVPPGAGASTSEHSGLRRGPRGLRRGSPKVRTPSQPHTPAARGGSAAGRAGA